MSNPSMLGFVSKINKSQDYYFPHHLLLSHNLQNDTVHSRYENVPYNFSYPFPISDYALPLNEDQYIKIICDKVHWSRKMDSLKTLHKRLTVNSKIGDITYSCNATTDIPSYILKFAKLLQQNPDPHLDSHFNWYMSGRGNISSLSQHFTSFVTAVGNKLYIRGFDGDLVSECISNNHIQYTCKNMEPIYETICSSNSQKQIIALRQKNRVYLLATNEDVINEMLIHKSDIPITSIIMDKSSENLLFSDINGNVNELNVESGVVLKFLESSEYCNKNSWSSLHMLDNSSMVQVDRKCLQILDKRKSEPWSMSTLSNDSCDYITNTLLDSNSIRLYLGTLHHFYECDIRYMPSENPQLKKWTHGLKSPPIYSINHNFDDNDVIVLGSHLPQELCLINNNITNSNHDMTVFDTNNTEQHIKTETDVLYLPIHLPNIMDLHNEAQMKGFCLNPTVNLKERLSLSRTGLAQCASNNCLRLFSINAAGDIFSQIISDERHETYNEISILENWSEKLRLSKAPLIVSSQRNLKYIQNSLKRIGHPKVRGRSIRFGSEMKVWKSSLHDLNNYTDMWANELLSIWDVKETNQSIDNLIAPPVDTRFKIDKWIKDCPIDIEEE